MLNTDCVMFVNSSGGKSSDLRRLVDLGVNKNLNGCLVLFRIMYLERSAFRIKLFENKIVFIRLTCQLYFF